MPFKQINSFSSSEIIQILDFGSYNNRTSSFRRPPLQLLDTLRLLLLSYSLYL